MTITATNYFDGGAVFGYVSADIPARQTLDPFLFPIADMILDDLESTPFPPDLSTPNPWSVVWYVNAYIPNTLNNANKFKSALPKFDLGIIANVWRGQVSSEYYINYTSQRFPVQTCWEPPEFLYYPAPYIAPAPIVGGTLSLNGQNIFGLALQYADSCYISFVSGSIQEAVIIAYYQAIHLDTNTPLSLGDI